MSKRFIEKYEIVSTLGRGSMGVVYKGRDPEIGRLVAIKTLKSVFLGDDPAGNEALQRFRQESRSAGRLHHPNIVTIFEAGRTDSGSPFIVMEYIEGKSIEALIAEKGSLAPLAVLHYLAQIASAIDYAHGQNVIHRDIKPSNILVDSTHRTHLLDFGVAKLSDTSLTPAGTVVGTPGYMSPEQIRGATLDGRTDLFSLGVVAFEAFTGTRPFPGSDFTTVVSNIIHKDPLPFSEVGSDLPVELEEVLWRGLAKEREERYATALEFVDEMSQVFSAVVDGSGLAGGYDPEAACDVSVPDIAKTVTDAKVIDEVLESSGLQKADIDYEAPVEESAEDEDEETEAELEEPAANSLEEMSDESVSTITDEHVERAAADDAGKGELTAKGVRAKSGRKSRERKPWMLPLVLIILIAALAAGFVSLGGIEKVKERFTSGMLALEPSEEELDEEILVVQEEPVQEEEDYLEPPPIPPGGFTSAEVRALDDKSLLGLLRWRDASEKTLQLAIAEAGKRDRINFMTDLLALLRHENYKIRIVVLKGFGTTEYLENDGVLRAVISALDDRDALVRGFAAKALAATGDTAARDALAERLSEEKSEIVVKVIRQSLVRHGSTRR